MTLSMCFVWSVSTVQTSNTSVYQLIGEPDPFTISRRKRVDTNTVRGPFGCEPFDEIGNGRFGGIVKDLSEDWLDCGMRWRLTYLSKRSVFTGFIDNLRAHGG